jgi:hypothetical protein
MRAIGAEASTWGNAYDQLPPLEDKRPAETMVRGKVFDPSVTEASNGVYPSLEQAIAAARSGEVIYLRFNGMRRIDAIRLERAIEITLRPDVDCHPILSLDRTTESDAALFRVYDGHLKLEQLEFSVQPGRPEFRAQSLLALMGDGQCSLKNCVITLEETREVPVSLVTLADPSTIMRMDPVPGRHQEPAIRLEGCFVRGGGDLITVRASRSFELEVKDTLVVLQGTLLLIEGSTRELPTKPVARVTLRQVTSFLDNHLVWLRGVREEGRSGRGLGMTQIAAHDCLFASAGGKSLVHLDSVDTDVQMRQALYWDGSNNAYSNFAQLLDQQPAGEMSMALPPYDKTRWVAFTNESGGRFERARFNAPPGAGSSFALVRPSDFKLRADAELQGHGVIVDRLPRPFEADLEESSQQNP